MLNLLNKTKLTRSLPSAISIDIPFSYAKRGADLLGDYIMGLFGSKNQAARSNTSRTAGKRRGRSRGVGAGSNTRPGITTYIGDPMASNTISQGGYLAFAGHAEPIPGFPQSDSMRVMGRSHFCNVGGTVATTNAAFHAYPTSGTTSELLHYNSQQTLLLHPATIGSSRLNQISTVFRRYAFRYIKMTYVTSAISDTAGDFCIALVTDPIFTSDSFDELIEVSGSCVIPHRMNGAIHMDNDTHETWYTSTTVDTSSSELSLRQMVQGNMCGLLNTNATGTFTVGRILVEFVCDFYDSTPEVGLSSVSAREGVEEMKSECTMNRTNKNKIKF